MIERNADVVWKLSVVQDSRISVEPRGTQKTRRHFHFDICIIIIYGLLTVPDLDISVVYNNYLYFLNIGDTLLCL